MTNEKIRVALIVPGGIATGKDNIGVPVLERLVRLLSIQFEVTVFSLFRTNDDFVANTFELVDVSGNGSLSKFKKCSDAFRNRHHKKPYQVVHGFWAMPSGFLAVLISKRYGIKSIVSVLGGDAISLPEINYGQLQRWLPRKLIVWTLANASEVTTLTKYLWDNLLNVGLGKRKVNVIPWGIDVSQFSYSTKNIGSPVRFLHVANLHPVKDQFTLLRAFKLISESSNATLKIIGEGVLSAEVRKLTTELNLDNKVSFVDPMPYEKLAEHYAIADILLHTSLSEGQSEVVTEAMSSGVVVCGTAVGLMYDKPEICVGVNVGDYESLAMKVLQLLKDTQRMNQLKKEAHIWAMEHDIDWTTKMYAALYQP
ncbi:MAG: glycosyltransferase [Chryseolinea sp.]